MNCWRTLSVALGSVVVLIGAAASATTMRALDVGELSHQAEVVVVADVVSVGERERLRARPLRLHLSPELRPGKVRPPRQLLDASRPIGSLLVHGGLSRGVSSAESAKHFSR